MNVRGLGNIRLKTKFGLLIGLLVVVSLVANIGWTSMNARAQMENEQIGRAHV